MDTSSYMEYNTSRPRMIIPEYGRNVQNMVHYLLEIEDREERNKQARNLIAVIANLNPQVYQTDEDPEHKLWDHLYIMSDFKLDVDAPYPPPSPEELYGKPEAMEYPRKERLMRHYGSLVRKMIDYAVALPEGEERQALTESIANVMKKHYLTWNKDNVEDRVILENLESLSEGKLKLEGLDLADKSELALANANANKKPHQQGHSAYKRKKRKKRKN